MSFYENLIRGIPCPSCGLYNPPCLDDQFTFATAYCRIHGFYRVSVKKSLSFREFCSRIARKPNRSPDHYTSSELMVKGVLDSLGIPYKHNVKIPYRNSNGRLVYYWIDFILEDKSIAIEVNPSVWHKLWNRNTSDQRKARVLRKLGFSIYNIGDRELRSKRRLERRIRKILDKILTPCQDQGR